MKNLKGFTLIELMIVMVIIGILLSLLLPGVFQGRRQALKIEDANNLRQCGIALWSYAKDYDGELKATNWDTVLTTEGYLDTIEVTKCKSDDTTYTADFSDGDNLYSMTTGETLLTCTTYEQSLYSDGRVE